ITKNVEKGSTVFTDESKAYNSLINKDFEHGTVNHSAKEYVNGMASTDFKSAGNNQLPSSLHFLL
ncbi:MAG: transposase, partial [Candidatus Dadabacteria bacterium]|nr:transposase [Candidatus Dadabacteria bacterium]